jgi:hypothetical protein
MSGTRLYVRVRGKVMGPFSLGQLQTLRDRGQFRSFHEVSEDRTGWRPASSLPGMFNGDEPSATAAPPAPRIPTAPAEEEWYYVASDGKKVGPVGREQLARIAGAGVIRPETRVWMRDTPAWIPFSKSGIPAPSAAPTPGPDPGLEPTVGPLRAFFTNPVGGLAELIAGVTAGTAAGLGVLFYICFLSCILLAMIAGDLFRDLRVFEALQQLARNPRRVEVVGKLFLLSVLPLVSFWATLSALRLATRSHGSFGADGLIAGAIFLIPGLLILPLIMFIGVSYHVCLFIVYFAMTVCILQLNAVFSRSLRIPDLGILFAIPAVFFV